MSLFHQTDENVVEFRLASADENGVTIPDGPAAHIRIEKNESSVRIVMDPYGEDHDVLIEQQADKWLVFVHPWGQDPVCIATLTTKSALVEDNMGNKLAEESV